MRPITVLVALLVAIALLAALAVAHTAAPAPPPTPAAVAPDQPRVKLAVLVVFDQMRGDYLEKWRGLFGKRGFARLQNEGAWFTHCHYPYGGTITGPGHASMLSGTCPDRHGIVMNNWYESGELVYCAGSQRYDFVPRVPPPPPDPKNPKPAPKEVGNPDRMLAETVADALHAARPGSKVFGLSLKDRSAILPTGKRPDGAYWFHTKFVTSTYYDDREHPWVTAFNDSKFADQWFGRDWTRYRSDIDYEAWSGADDVRGEGTGALQGRTFPHPTTGGKPKLGREYYDALANSPYGNDLLLEFAKTCVTAEKLGTDDVPDLLVVSFSSNDLIGHTWGPDSQEVLDVTLRSDAIIADFLAFLDEKVGRGQYLFAVTADHGVCPLVEVSASRGIDAKRVDAARLQKEIEEYLTAKFGAPLGPKTGGKKPAWVETTQLPWVYFNPKVVAAAGKTRAEVARVAVDFLATHPDISRAFTRADLVAGFPESDIVGSRVRRSFWQPAGQQAERCGDVYVVLRPYYLPTAKPFDPLKPETGTTHGTPFNYDTHVPLLVYGPGIPGGVRTEPIAPQAAAAIFSRWLGVRPPDKADFPVPATLEHRR
jgi:hypothetical protein